MSIRNPFDINLFEVLIQEPADPGAGNQFSLATPLNSRSMIAVMSWTLVTDGTAINREASIQRAEAPVNQRIGGDPIPTTASTTAFYTAGVGLTAGFGSNPLNHTIALPPSPLFLSGDSMRISIVGLQGADRIEDVIITWHIWKFPQ